jgi:hypothetical protein
MWRWGGILCLFAVAALLSYAANGFLVGGFCSGETCGPAEPSSVVTFTVPLVALALAAVYLGCFTVLQSRSSSLALTAFVAVGFYGSFATVYQIAKAAYSRPAIGSSETGWTPSRPDQTLMTVIELGVPIAFLLISFASMIILRYLGERPRQKALDQVA